MSADDPNKHEGRHRFSNRTVSDILSGSLTNGVYCFACQKYVFGNGYSQQEPRPCEHLAEAIKDHTDPMEFDYIKPVPDEDEILLSFPVDVPVAPGVAVELRLHPYDPHDPGLWIARYHFNHPAAYAGDGDNDIMHVHELGFVTNMEGRWALRMLWRAWAEANFEEFGWFGCVVPWHDVTKWNKTRDAQGPKFTSWMAKDLIARAETGVCKICEATNDSGLIPEVKTRFPKRHNTYH